MEIKYINRETGKLEIEKVYGDKVIHWFYNSKIGGLLSDVIASKATSKLYGILQDGERSKNKISEFIKSYHINMDDFLPDVGREASDPYFSFNKFFIRKFKDGKRSFISESSTMPAFSEARYFGFKKITEDIKLPVKGKQLDLKSIISHQVWEEVFEDGPLMIARLCPVDYHRFHYPDDGKVVDRYRVKGKLHSVNPIALRAKEDIFFTNEREITIIETENFGRLAYIEVGATCVGKIVQSNRESSFKRGEEKGYFLFGGSTVIVIGEKGKWAPTEDILVNSLNGLETYIKLGDAAAKSL